MARQQNTDKEKVFILRRYTYNWPEMDSNEPTHDIEDIIACIDYDKLEALAIATQLEYWPYYSQEYIANNTILYHQHYSTIESMEFLK